SSETRLNVAHSRPQLARKRARAVHRAVDQTGVDDLPKHSSRALLDRLNDHLVVDLVHVVLVFEEPRRLPERFSPEPNPSEPQPSDRNDRRHDRESDLFARVRLALDVRARTFYRRRRCSNDRGLRRSRDRRRLYYVGGWLRKIRDRLKNEQLEVVQVHSACKRPGHSEKSNKSRAYREHYKRRQHRPWRFVRFELSVPVVSLVANRVPARVFRSVSVIVVLFGEAVLTPEGQDDEPRHINCGQKRGDEPDSPEDQ